MNCPKGCKQVNNEYQRSKHRKIRMTNDLVVTKYKIFCRHWQKIWGSTRQSTIH